LGRPCIYEEKPMFKEFNIRSLIPLAALGVLCVVFTFFNPRFASMDNLMVIGRQMSIMLVAAVGQTFVILTGGIDLSVLGVMSMSSLVLSMLVENVKNPMDFGLLALPIAIAVGAAFGLLNGALHTKTKIPSFMVTLGTGYVGSGLAVIIYKGRPIRILDGSIRDLAIGNTEVFGVGVPHIMIWALVIMFIGMMVARHTRLGRYIYAMGGDESKLQLVGVDVDKYKIMMFTLAGMFFAAAGVLYAARTGAGTAKFEPQLLLYVVASVVIGGTALTGGVGKIWQTLVGALILTVLGNGLILMRANPFIQDAIIGAVTIVAVALTLDRRKIGIIK
jgi:ribose transport system permease protein